MTNPIWKGHISFGLVNIPIALFSAEKRSELRFHLLDARDQARIRYERVNDETGKEVPWDKIVKAYEFDKNNYVVLSNDDFKRAAPEASKSIDIENFVNIDEINLVYFERPYYLVPEKAGEKGYVLLRQALEKSGKVAVAKVVIREKQYLAAVVPKDDALILNLLRFKQEILPMTEFDFPDKDLKSYRISAAELKIADQLISSMTKKWRPETYHDEYRESLMHWIEEKIASHGKKPRATKKVVERSSAKTIDFMDALKRSLAKAKKPTVKKTTAHKKHKTK